MPVCSLCAHEWSPGAGGSVGDSGFGLSDAPVIKVSVGNPLAGGDTVAIVKTLKVHGKPSDTGVGGEVRTIRLVYGSGVHDIDCEA
jgi:protein PhnA